MTKIEEIYEAVLPEMKANGIEDTPENRISFLSGLRDGWNEDPERSIQKTLYIIAVTMEITHLKLKLTLKK